jgi:hypothetical protein
MSEMQITIESTFADNATAAKQHESLESLAKENNNELSATFNMLADDCYPEEYEEIWIDSIKQNKASISIKAYSGASEIGPLAEALFVIGAIKTVIELDFDEGTESRHYLGERNVTEEQFTEFRKRGKSARKAVEDFSQRTPRNSWTADLEKCRKAIKKHPELPELELIYKILSSEICEPYKDLYFLCQFSPPSLFNIRVPRKSDDMYGGSIDGLANQILFFPDTILGSASEGYKYKGYELEITLETTDKGERIETFDPDDFAAILDCTKEWLKELESYIGAA